MALSLGVHKGSRVSIGHSILEVLDIVYGRMVSIKVDNEVHDVTDKQRVEIMPDVFVTYGQRPGQNGSHARLAFEAPMSVKIMRL